MNCEFDGEVGGAERGDSFWRGRRGRGAEGGGGADEGGGARGETKRAAMAEWEMEEKQRRSLFYLPNNFKKNSPPGLERRLEYMKKK